MESKTLTINREKILDLLKKYPQEKSDMNHYLESEAIMRALAKKFGEDENYWGAIGLLHDVDWSLTKSNLEQHCIKAEEILEEAGFDEEFIKIIQSHGYAHEEIPQLKNKERNSKIEYSLVASETLTGIIHAYSLMRGGEISGMDASGLKKKFKDKKFAANCNREIIKEIEKTGLSRDEFFELAIEAVKNIKEQVGLK